MRKKPDVNSQVKAQRKMQALADEINLTREEGEVEAIVDDIHGEPFANLYWVSNSRRRYADDTVWIHGDWFRWGPNLEYRAETRDVAAAAREVIATGGKLPH